MAEAWTDIADSDLAQDKPLRQSITRALRDNPQGIAAGVSGAPQIQTAALVAAERMTTTNVRAAYAGLSGAPVGSFVLGLTSGGVTENGTVAGSSIVRTSIALDGDLKLGGSTISGTWRNMGGDVTIISPGTLWHRIS